MDEKGYKILIADDEGIVTESLSLIISKEFNDKCTVRVAASGRQVIEIEEEFGPDIILMDIQMPGINGIEAIEEIKKTNKSAVFIVISAYDKFTYAKEALKLGVMEYLTKPTNKKKIISTIKKAMIIVDKNREKRNKDLLMKEKINKVVPIIESGMIYSILFQEVYSTEITNYKNLLGLTSDFGFVMIIQYGDEDEDGKLTNPVGNSVKAQSFYPALKEITREFFDGIVGPIMVNQIVVVVPWEQSEISYDERINIIDKARKLNRKLKTHIDTTFRIGIGNIERLDQLSKSYKEAVCVLKENRERILHVKDISAAVDKENDYPNDRKKEIIRLIKEGKTIRAKVEAEQYIEWLIDNHKIYKFDLHAKIYEVLIYAEDKAYDLGIENYNFVNRGDYLKELIKIDSIEELKQWYLEKMTNICTTIVTQKKTETNTIILKAKNYISQNYRKDISLDDVSHEVDISPYYFSKLFKEETGENFIDYLTKVRIDEAKNLLLRNKETSIKSICMDVGYSDPNYFSRIFKKCTGQTPTQYRERKL